MTDGEPRVDSRLLATRLGIEHKAIIQLLDKNFNDFADLGHLRFEMEVGYRVQGGGNPQRFLMLDDG